MAVLFLIALFIVGFFVFKKSFPASQMPATSSSNTVYTNTIYGFNFNLPENWKGYTVTVDKWIGYAIDAESGNVPFANGPIILIHNPKWIGANTYQNIPIMVFTLDEWDQLQQEKFHIGVAPIGPSALGRNSKYVFALPARYNFAFPPSYEEVDKIIQSKPLVAF